ncbi:MAG TPA: hypothetical protein VIK37_02145 [Candidatus Saccharimonadales bacterium]
MKFSTKQLRLLLLGLLAISAIAFMAAAVLGLNSLSRKSGELVDLKLKGKTLDAQLISLETAKKQVEQYSYFNDVAKTVLPTDKDQAKAVLTIAKFANESNFKLGSITFPTSNLGLKSSSSAAGSSASAISQAKPVEGIKGLYSLQLIITPDTTPYVPINKVVTYPKFIDFLKRIEQDRRTAQITSVAIQQLNEANLPPDAINFTLTINIFMRPEK